MKIKEKLTTLLPTLALSVLLAVCVAVTVLTTTLRCYHIILNGQQTTLLSFSSDIEKVLEKSGLPIEEHYVIETTSPSPMTSTITIHTTFDVTITVDGATHQKELSASATRGEVLEAFGVIVDEDDLFTMNEQDILTSDCTLVVNRIEKKTETYQEAIACPVNDITQPELGTETVTAPGKEGLREVTAIRTYTDGVITHVQELESKILKEPTTTTIYSAQPIEHPEEGVPTDYKKVMICESTAYCLRGTTATGKRTQVGYVAVDPKTIPLGSLLYIKSLTPGVEDYGYCIAADTGAAIKGQMVDVYFYTKEECVSWGRRDIEVYLVK